MLFFKLIFILLLVNIKIINCNNVYVAFRIDDLGIDNVEVYKNILPLFNKYKVPLTIGVVPFKIVGNRIHSTITQEIKELISPYVQTGKVQVGMHGYVHNNNYLKDGIISEFYSLDSIKQRNYIILGKKSLEDQLNVNITLFIPPYNTYDDITTSILSNLNFNVISAARYGSIGFETIKIKYIPYTSNLQNFKRTLYNINISENDSQNIVFVILFHVTDFSLNNSTSYLNYGDSDDEVSIADLEFILKEVNTKGLKCVTIDSLSKLKIDFSNNRLRNTFFPEPLLPIPTILVPTFLGSYYHYSKTEIIFKRILLPVLYYIFIVFISFISVKLLGKKKLFLLLNKVFVGASLILLIFISLGKLHSVGIMLLIYFLSSVFFYFIFRDKIFN